MVKIELQCLNKKNRMAKFEQQKYVSINNFVQNLLVFWWFYKTFTLHIVLFVFDGIEQFA